MISKNSTVANTISCYYQRDRRRNSTGLAIFFILLIINGILFRSFSTQAETGQVNECIVVIAGRILMHKEGEVHTYTRRFTTMAT
jgi:hypothetical protein